MATPILSPSKTVHQIARKAPPAPIGVTPPAVAYLGLQIEGDEGPRWYPIPAARAETLLALLGEFGDEWITLYTLNNRALLIHTPAVRQIVIQHADAGNPSGDWYSPAVYHGLWGYCLAGDDEFVDPAVRAEVNGIVRSRGLDSAELVVMFRMYELHRRDGSSTIKMLPAEGRGAGRVFDAARQDDRVALLDMPLQLVAPGAYRPVSQWLDFGRSVRLDQLARAA